MLDQREGVRHPDPLSRRGDPLHPVVLEHLRAQRARSGPEGPACGPEVPARASVATPLYLKLLTRQTINPNTRQTKIQRLDRQKSSD